MAGPMNKDALFEAHFGHLHGAARREARAKFDPYSRKEIAHSMQQMIMGALHELGGQRWLVKQGQQYPVAFMALCAKVMPFEARNAANADIRVIVETVPREAVDADNARGVLNTPLTLVSSRTVEG